MLNVRVLRIVRAFVVASMVYGYVEVTYWHTAPVAAGTNNTLDPAQPDGHAQVAVCGIYDLGRW